MVTQIGIDFALQDRPDVEEYFLDVWLSIVGASDRQWLEPPQDTAECLGLDPILDFTADRITSRGVYGYVAFGTWGAVSHDLFPALPEALKHVIWKSHEFINWREQLFRAPDFCNVIRVWLRHKNRAYGNIRTKQFIPLGPAGKWLLNGVQKWPPIP